jgi:phosphoribosylformimino-5-aminoimidazole carboxamide ribotide isomerase
VAAGIDIRDGRVAIEGWETESARSLDEVIDDLKAQGVRWVVCTDVQRDGVLAGPSEALAQRMVSEKFEVIVAGGIASVADIARIRDVGAAGCIIGRALYTGSISLPDALEAARAD